MEGIMRARTLAVTIAVLLIIAQAGIADVEVGTDGKVGVGVAPDSQVQLRVGAGAVPSLGPPGGTACGVTGQAADAFGNAGLYGKASGGYNSYGIYGSAEGAIGSTYGVYASSDGSGTGTSYGVYASAVGGSNNYAGYFAGDVMVTGSISSPSDVEFKQDIEPLTGILPKIMSVNPKSFSYRKDAPELQGMNLPAGKQYGLIAQELENVFPELVTAAMFSDPKSAKEDGTPEKVEYKAVLYLKAIPLLIQAIQEQQQQIEALKAELSKK